MTVIEELIVGTSVAIKRIRALIAHIADTGLNIMIYGEEGAGKSLVARALYQLSPRSNKLFYQFDCSSTTHKYFEFELFGYEEGVSTGTGKEKEGLLELANGGVIIFDNVDQFPIETQAKLLHLLQTNEFHRIGSQKKFKPNIFFIATSTQNIEEKIKSGLMREDLFYRMNVIKIDIPPLRSRPEDIEPLIFHFLSQMGKNPTEFMTDLNNDGLMPYLLNYSWPGNVRELKQIIDTLLITNDWKTIRNRLLGRGMASSRITIERCIEFPAEYKQAGISILSFFGEVLKQKHPNMEAVVRIEQDGLNIRMVIEPKSGEPEIIEKTLDEYGLVITGQMSPEKFTSDPFLVISLKHELSMAKARIEAQKELLHYQECTAQEKDARIDQLISLIGMALKHNPNQNFQIDVSPTISSSNRFLIDLSNSVNNISKLLETLSGKGLDKVLNIKEIDEIKRQLQELNLHDVSEVKTSTALVKLRGIIKKLNDAEGHIGKTIGTIKNGYSTVQKLAKYYNEVAQWFGLPQVPTTFLKRSNSNDVNRE